MTDTILLRRILNQACINKQLCHIIKCHSKSVSCCGALNNLQPNNWWIALNKIPCFVCSHNRNKVPIHPQDPMK